LIACCVSYTIPVMMKIKTERCTTARITSSWRRNQALSQP
jgi:hypothetical protein